MGDLNLNLRTPFNSQGDAFPVCDVGNNFDREHTVVPPGCAEPSQGEKGGTVFLGGHHSNTSFTIGHIETFIADKDIAIDLDFHTVNGEGTFGYTGYHINAIYLFLYDVRGGAAVRRRGTCTYAGDERFCDGRRVFLWDDIGDVTIGYKRGIPNKFLAIVHIPKASPHVSRFDLTVYGTVAADHRTRVRYPIPGKGILRADLGTGAAVDAALVGFCILFYYPDGFYLADNFTSFAPGTFF